jgi:precorrin-3B synthase
LPGDLLNEPLPAPLPAALPRTSACPGLLRIVAARDGGLCRIKLPGGVLTAAGAWAVADASRRFGNGAVELTNRANLQLRGIAPANQDRLVAQVMAAGLGPASAGADDVRNLMLSPMAGLDPTAALDTRPLAAELLRALEQDLRYHQLSPKFAIQLDGGEALAELHHPHDLWLSPLWLAGEWHLALGLASAIATATPVAAVPIREGVALLLAVLDRFLALAGPAPGRLREVLERYPAPALLEGLKVNRGPFAPLPPRAVPPALGLHRQQQPGHVSVGLAPALGRMSGDELSALARLSCDFAQGELCLTPWQGLLLPGVTQENAPAVQAQVQALGLLVDHRAPLAALVACTGSAGCNRGLADTKADAQRLATLLGHATPVHLTGCARSCAHPWAAPVTLLAVSPGRYDLFFRDPLAPGFGRPQGHGLTLQDAATQIAACSWSTSDD